MTLVKDGTILAGGFTISLDVSLLTILVNSCSFNRPVNTLVQTDENDEPSAAAHWKGFATGSMEIQTSDGSVTEERIDLSEDTFTTDEIEGSSKKYRVTESNVTRGKGSTLATGTLGIAEVLNP